MTASFLHPQAFRDELLQPLLLCLALESCS